MNFFKKKKKTVTEKFKLNDESRRNFLTKFSASVLGAGAMAAGGNLFAAENKNQKFLYVKQNGETSEYNPSGGSLAYLGSLLMVGFDFAPVGWYSCNGQLLSIADNDALFQLIGTTYGGNGTTNFALPDLRSRIPLHQGQGPGLTNRILGETAGVESVTLTLGQIPAHNHAMKAGINTGTSSSPANGYFAQNADGINSFNDSTNSNLNTASITSTGGSQAHSNIQPYTAINFIIAAEGLYPIP
jgi:microcystin-dependent protein